MMIQLKSMMVELQAEKTEIVWIAITSVIPQPNTSGETMKIEVTRPQAQLLKAVELILAEVEPIRVKRGK